MIVQRDSVEKLKGKFLVVQTNRRTIAMLNVIQTYTNRQLHNVGIYRFANFLCLKISNDNLIYVRDRHTDR